MLLRIRRAIFFGKRESSEFQDARNLGLQWSPVLRIRFQGRVLFGSFDRKLVNFAPLTLG